MQNTPDRQLPASLSGSQSSQSSSPSQQLPVLSDGSLDWLTPKTKEFCLFAVESGFFKEGGVTNMAQAVMKVAYGASLGLTPMEALNELYVVRGKVVMEPNCIATHLANHPVYGIEVLSVDETQCTVRLLKNGQPYKDPVKVTFDDAVTAGWTRDRNGGTKTAWKVDRKMMLYYKAAARAQRLFARDLFKTALTIYDFEEIVEADEVTPIGSKAGDAAIMNAGSKRGSARKNKDIAQENTQNPETAPEQEHGSETADTEVTTVQPQEVLTSLPEPSAASEPARTVTGPEIVAGVNSVKKNGWSAPTVTKLAQEKVREGVSLMQLTTVQFAELIAFCAEHTVKQDQVGMQ